MDLVICLRGVIMLLMQVIASNFFSLNNCFGVTASR